MEHAADRAVAVLLDVLPEQLCQLRAAVPEGGRRPAIEHMFDQSSVPADRQKVISDRYQPPRPVWVDLGVVFPLRERPAQFFPEALDLQAQVPGEAHMHALTTTGLRVVYVTFSMRSTRGGFEVTQWVVARAVQSRADSADRRDAKPR